MWKWAIIIILNIACISLGFNWGRSAGFGFTAGKAARYESNVCSKLTHTVTVVWDEEGTQTSTYYIREDLNWSVSGDVYGSSLYSTGTNPSSISLSSVNNRAPQGKTFGGLWSSPYGGTMYVNCAGYSLRNITANTTLYAVWI